MLEREHNVVNILYGIKGMIEIHLARTEEETFKDKDEASRHASKTFKRIYVQANRALLTRSFS